MMQRHTQTLIHLSFLSKLLPSKLLLPKPFQLKNDRRWPLPLVIGALFFLLAGCQPIQSINLPPAADGTPAQAAVATEAATEEPLLLIPTDTPAPTAEVPATATAAPTEAPTELPTETATLAPAEASPTEALVLLVPTDTPLPTNTALPTATPVSAPQIKAINSLNVRSGPSTDYGVINGLAPDTTAAVIGRNGDASWWQITLADGSSGWVYAQLVEFAGESTNIPVVEVAPPPPTATPLPLPTVAAENPQIQTVANVVPTEAPAPQPSSSDAPTFRIIQKRLWDVYENGGSLNGDSVICGEKRQLVVIVVNSDGVRINGVAVQVEYGAKETFVTGDQGKGEGTVEFVLGSGQDVKVLRNDDGRDAVSEVATGLVTRPDVIPFADLIAGRYCTDDASCTHFVNAPGCFGHYSWTVIFQRNY